MICPTHHNHITSFSTQTSGLVYSQEVYSPAWLIYFVLKWKKKINATIEQKNNSTGTSKLLSVCLSFRPSVLPVRDHTSQRERKAVGLGQKMAPLFPLFRNHWRRWCCQGEGKACRHGCGCGCRGVTVAVVMTTEFLFLLLWWMLWRWWLREWDYFGNLLVMTFYISFLYTYVVASCGFLYSFPSSVYQNIVLIVKNINKSHFLSIDNCSLALHVVRSWCIVQKGTVMVVQCHPDHIYNNSHSHPLRHHTTPSVHPPPPIPMYPKPV